MMNIATVKLSELFTMFTITMFTIKSIYKLWFSKIW